MWPYWEAGWRSRNFQAYLGARGVKWDESLNRGPRLCILNQSWSRCSPTCEGWRVVWNPVKSLWGSQVSRSRSCRPGSSPRQPPQPPHPQPRCHFFLSSWDSRDKLCFFGLHCSAAWWTGRVVLEYLCLSQAGCISISPSSVTAPSQPLFSFPPAEVTLSLLLLAGCCRLGLPSVAFSLQPVWAEKPLPPGSFLSFPSGSGFFWPGAHILQSHPLFLQGKAIIVTLSIKQIKKKSSPVNYTKSGFMWPFWTLHRLPKDPQQMQPGL